MAEQMPAVGMQRKLAAIFSTDVAGYSRLMGDDEEATILTLTAYRSIISSLIQQYRGRVVDSPGDNLLAEFASVVDTVRCAVEIQHALKTKNTELPPHRQMQFRIGINLGDVIVEGERLYGDGVNIAARLESLALPGGICISGTVYDQVETKLPLDYDYQGEQTVKNIAKPVRVYRVVTEPVAAVSPREEAGQKSPVESSTLHISYSALRTQEALPLPDKPSIAVLPFTNMSGDPEQEYFSDGITDDLITDLSKLSGLFVIARNSVFTYKDKAVDVGEVSRKLGVRYLVEGSVRKAGTRVRINAQLVDATTGGHLWAERYDRELQDIFALQDEVTQKIVFALKIQLTPEDQARFRQAPTNNLEAYDSFLRGQAYFWRFTREANNQARQMFERAIELDPQYAGAYAVLSWTYLVEWVLQWNQEPQLPAQVSVVVQRAVALDDSLPLTHMILGVAYLWQKQHEQALAEGEKALTLASNYADGYAWLGNSFNFAGRPQEAIEAEEKALRLNPHDPFFYLFNLGFAYRLLGRYEEAITAFKRVLSRNPDFLPAHVHLPAAYSELGQEADARAEAAEILRLSPHFSLERVRQRLPFKDQAELERLLAGLRKAGLK
jgi:TolB-like protein/class 3 adenylate cyclase